MNKYAPHVYVIPEDDANRQLANGFEGHCEVRGQRIQIMPPAGGWPKVRKTFEEEYLPLLHNYPLAHVVMLIDFDGDYEHRRETFEEAIPAPFKSRVFVIGVRDEPEVFQQAMGRSLEALGEELAAECAADAFDLWAHEQLAHNYPDRERLSQTVRPFLF